MRRLLVLLVTVGVLGAGCGGDDSTAGSSDDDITSTSTAMESDGMGGMNMGDPMATPAEEVPGAELVTAPLVLLDTRPEGYDDTTGTVALARHEAGTTVTIRLEGLTPGVDYIAHVHEGSCADAGGPHFKFDPDGADVPPNEIHLAFSAAADGTGFMTAENDQTAGSTARSVVVHPVELLDNTLACFEF